MNRLIIATLGLTLGLLAAGGLVSPLVASEEQRHFSAEDVGVRAAISLTKELLDTLGSDERVRAVMAEEGVRGTNPPESWFSASAAHLGVDREIDIVVKGQGPLLGANVTPFWIFRSSHGAYALVLNVYAHDLVIENIRTKGMLNVNAISATASRVATVYFKFDGSRYVVSHRKAERN